MKKVTYTMHLPKNRCITSKKRNAAEHIIYMHACTHACTHRHAYIHTHTHAHTYTFIHTHTRIHTYKHTRTHTHTHTYTHIQTHTHTHAHTCMHTNTHVYTHTLSQIYHRSKLSEFKRVSFTKKQKTIDGNDVYFGPRKISKKIKQHSHGHESAENEWSP